jgi:hypothetical protein
MDPTYQYQQIIILLTDGLNTQDRWYTSQSSIDARQQLTCNNINAAGITALHHPGRYRRRSNLDTPAEVRGQSWQVSRLEQVLPADVVESDRGDVSTDRDQSLELAHRPITRTAQRKPGPIARLPARVRQQFTPS